MAIKKSTAFTASDGSMHATVEGAQRCDLIALITPVVENNVGVNSDGDLANSHEVVVEAIVNTLFAESDRLLDILTTGPRSRPAARKSKGTVNPKRAAKAATPASTEAKVERLREETFKAGVAAIRAAVDEGVPT